MHRHNQRSFNPQGGHTGAVSGSKTIPATRVPQQFIEAMKRVSAGQSDMAATTQQKAPSAIEMWKSSFKPVGEGDEDSQDKSGSTEKSGLYDPYEPLSSDSEFEMQQGQENNPSPPIQDNNLEHQCLSPARDCPDSRHWDPSYAKPGNGPVDGGDFNTGIRPVENQSLSPGLRQSEQLAYGQDADSLHRPSFGSLAEPLNQRGDSPDRLIPSASTQQFPASYGQRTDGEERITVTVPEYKIETIRLSPPRLQVGYMKKGLDQDLPSIKVMRNMGKPVINKTPITCDLCEVQLANGQELQDHLDSKCHWDTLEHIQQNNKYDDVMIAFLQEVMLYKSHHCSRAVEDDALQTLQENDHMTKVEMFHCAACKVYISTSAAEVQTHISSEEHLSCTKAFEVHQRHACLSKAETMIKELKPQFEHFKKGGSPFE